MKTKNFEKMNSQIEVLSENEMKEVYGGVRYYVIEDSNGNIRVVVVP